MASTNEPRVKDVLSRAWEMLEHAEKSLTDVRGTDPIRRRHGLYDVFVYGRSVTLVLQNLRSAVDRFDEWYGPFEVEMAADPLMKWATARRNEILKEGTAADTVQSMHIKSLNTNDLKPIMEDPPPGAQGFFIGDRWGGVGWDVLLPDGSKTVYYVELPPHVEANIEHSFKAQNPLQAHRGKAITNAAVDELLNLYTGYLRNLLHLAEQEFLGVPPPEYLTNQIESEVADTP